MFATVGKVSRPSRARSSGRKLEEKTRLTRFILSAQRRAHQRSSLNRQVLGSQSVFLARLVLTSISSLTCSSLFSTQTELVVSSPSIASRFDSPAQPDLAPSLFSSSDDKLDVDACLARGISASHTPGAVDNATATTAVFLILASIRQFYKAEKSVRAGSSSLLPPLLDTVLIDVHLKSRPSDLKHRSPAFSLSPASRSLFPFVRNSTGNWKNDLPLARDPENKTLGIVGMGGIGALVAKRMCVPPFSLFLCCCIETRLLQGV